MKKRFSQIVSDGSLSDNRAHTAKNRLLSLGYSQQTIEILNERPRETQHYWSCLKSWAHEVNHSLRSQSGSLVFVTDQKNYEHNSQDDLFELRGLDAFNFTLTTGNVIGCISKQGTTFRISSRFGDEFLKYIISDADGFLEIPEHGGESAGHYDWLLIFFWLVKLKKALRLGLPKSYETRSEILPHVRGTLDVAKYFLSSGLGQYHCTYREHRYDNDITRLIAHTLRTLDTNTLLKGTHAVSQMFQAATHGEKASMHQLLSTKHSTNPYFADYNPVIDLAKQILRNQYSNFGDRQETSAILFDVSMLFEYFIRKLLDRKGVHFHRKSNEELSIPCGLLNAKRRRQLIPDLVFEVDGSTFVFDVKYKAYDFRFGVNREDLFQLHTYAGQVANSSNLAGCGLIYPIRETRWASEGLDKSAGIIKDMFKLAGYAVPFYVVFLKIPEQGDISVEDWPKRFHADFTTSCDSFVNQLLRSIITPIAKTRRPTNYKADFR